MRGDTEDCALADKTAMSGVIVLAFAPREQVAMGPLIKVGNARRLILIR
jgi:hypothetical protein